MICGLYAESIYLHVCVFWNHERDQHPTFYGGRFNYFLVFSLHAFYKIMHNIRSPSFVIRNERILLLFIYIMHKYTIYMTHTTESRARIFYKCIQSHYLICFCAATPSSLGENKFTHIAPS